MYFVTHLVRIVFPRWCRYSHLPGSVWGNFTSFPASQSFNKGHSINRHRVPHAVNITKTSTLTVWKLIRFLHYNTLKSSIKNIHGKFSTYMTGNAKWHILNQNQKQYWSAKATQVNVFLSCLSYISIKNCMFFLLFLHNTKWQWPKQCPATGNWQIMKECTVNKPIG